MHQKDTRHHRGDWNKQALDPTVKSLLFTILAYLIGSIPVGLIVCHVWAGIDIREYGSGNIGMTNVYRCLRDSHGHLPWVMTLALDFAKGYIPVHLALIWLGRSGGGAEYMYPQFYSTYVGLVVLAVMLGNLYPIYVSFRGGKGIATGLGVFSALIGFYVLIPISIFAIFLLASRMVSIGSLAAIISVPATFYIMGMHQWGLFNPGNRDTAATPGIFVGLTTIIALVIIFKHKGNIQRIIKGKEPKISLGRSIFKSSETGQAEPAEQAEVKADAEK